LSNADGRSRRFCRSDGDEARHVRQSAALGAGRDRGRSGDGSGGLSAARALLGANPPRHLRSAKGLAAERGSAAGSADIHGSASGIAPGARANRTLPAGASGAQGSGDDLPHGAGRSRQEGALYRNAARRGARGAAGSRAGLPHGQRTAGPQDSGNDLPHGLRRASGAKADPGVQDGGDARNPPRVALRGKTDSRDVHILRAARGLLSRADRSLRRAVDYISIGDGRFHSCRDNRIAKTHAGPAEKRYCERRVEHRERAGIRPGYSRSKTF